MKRFLIFFAFIYYCKSQPPYFNQENTRSDTIDIFHTKITLELGTVSSPTIAGHAMIKFAPKMKNINYIRLDLLKLTIDSVKINNVNAPYTYNDTVLRISFPPKNMNDTTYALIYYKGQPKTDPSTWGGFYFDNTGNAQYAYNMGVGFQSKPHNFGRVWFPCFDSFVERSTFEFIITTDSSRIAYCNGLPIQEFKANGKRTVHWYMKDPIPSYLASVTAAKYAQVTLSFPLMNGNIPVFLVATPADTTVMKNGFVNLQSCVQHFENCYGPYQWDRIGYCSVPFNAGAMEHATNISYPKLALGNLAYENVLMAHEIAHQWWGNLITCSTPEDMWINEGWASFSGFLFDEMQYGKNTYLNKLRAQHDDLLKKLHHKEGGFRAVSGVPHHLTYGDHVYKKGAEVAHALRAYMGDAVFFAAIKALMNNKKFSHVSSEDLRTQLQSASGINLVPFFKNWVYNGGWPHFAIDSVRSAPQGSQFIVQGSVKHKLYGAPQNYSFVPLEIAYFKNDWSFEIKTFTFTGNQTSQAFTHTLNFQPVYAVLNPSFTIPSATSYDYYKAKAVTNYVSSPGRLRVSVLQTGGDSSLIYLAHHFVKPDPFKNNPSGALLSDQHYWTVGGIWKPGLKLRLRFNFDGNKNYNTIYGYLDTLLTRVNSDSIRIFYRKDASQDWRMLPSYTLFVQSAKSGFIETDSVYIGEYALGNHGDTTVSIKEHLMEKSLLTLYPNPARHEIHWKFDKKNAEWLQPWEILVYDMNGKLKYISYQNNMTSSLSVENFENGNYNLILKCRDKIYSGKFSVKR
ncbi:MAG: M1 family aminopeptidase [Bacteroidia bacterium]|nr:M1 family aminopeptidase [Bacteroidia bacterium]